MSAYEDLIGLVRDEGSRNNPQGPQIGIVMDKGRIKLDALVLEKEDYFMDCNLRLDDKDKAYYHGSKPSSGEYLTDGAHNGTLKEYKANVLREGDWVIVFKLCNGNKREDEIERFAVLAKVVEPK